MKTLGMIGGTSWHSTIDYYRYLNSMVNERAGDLVSPPLLLYSLNIELMRSGDWERIAASYIEYAKMLENAGAEALIFCANTPHKVYPEVAPEINIPILHIADATAKRAKELDLTSLGLLGTLPTMKDDFISGRI